MQGAYWGWIALVGAIAVLFTASNYDQSGSNKVAAELRKDLRTVAAVKERLTLERDEARLQADAFLQLSSSLDSQLERAQADLRSAQAERDRIRKELASLSQERQQLLQTVASLQLERSQTRRNVDQLRQGLQQLLSQTDQVAGLLAAPPPGFSQIHFEESRAEPLNVSSAQPVVYGVCYGDEPQNDAK